MSREELSDPNPEPTTTPRRQVLRSLLGAVVGIGALIGLAACGGESGEDEEDEEDD